MDQEDYRIIWGVGVDWVIKRQDDQFFHRPEGDYGTWRPGVPPDTYELDVAHVFKG
jgi:hypothetical protein